jgi:hypothetical protein
LRTGPQIASGRVKTACPNTDMPQVRAAEARRTACFAAADHIDLLQILC